MDDLYIDKRVLVTVTDDGCSGHRYLHATTQVINRQPDGAVHYPSSSSWRANGIDEYADLTYRGQLGSWNHTVDHGDFYGHKPEFRQPYAVDLNRCETMVKVLRKIGRDLDKASDRYGTVDYAGMVRRFADSIGAESIGIYQRGHCFPESGDEYRWNMGVDALRWWLQKQISEWKERYGLTDKEQAA